jgi:hypothetical protein
MRRLMIAGGIVLAAATTALASTSIGAVSLRSFACRQALDPSRRSVSVTAVMGTVAGAQRLQMRFQLLRRSGGGVAALRGGDLGKWISPNPPTLGQHSHDVWIVRHPVTGVPVPGTYHFRVSFRWLGAAGHLLGRTTQTSASCREPDLRPDLWVSLLSVQPSGGKDQYVVQVGNGGLRGAANVEVSFAPGGGGQPQMITIPRLQSHATIQETFTGPACASATPPTITVDPNKQVSDLNRGNNSLTATCPAG